MAHSSEQSFLYDPNSRGLRPVAADDPRVGEVVKEIYGPRGKEFPDERKGEGAWRDQKKATQLTGGQTEVINRVLSNLPSEDHRPSGNSLPSASSGSWRESMPDFVTDRLLIEQGLNEVQDLIADRYLKMQAEIDLVLPRNPNDAALIELIKKRAEEEVFDLKVARDKLKAKLKNGTH